MNEQGKTEQLPVEAQQEIAKGAAMLGKGQIERATSLCNRLLRQYPDSPSVQFFAAQVGASKGAMDYALDALGRAAALAPHAPHIPLQRASLLLSLGRRLLAQESAARALSLAQGNNGVIIAAGDLLALSGNREQAVPAFESVPAGVPQYAAALFRLAQVNCESGRFEEALAHLSQHLALLPTSTEAVLMRSQLEAQTASSNHIPQLDALLADKRMPESGRAKVLFAKAKEQEDLSDFEAAFASLEQAASLQRSTVKYDGEAETANLDGIRQGFSQEAMNALKKGHESVRPIFIVGLPLSGISLLEQLLVNSTQVVSVGEIQDFSELMVNQIRALPRQELNSIEAAKQIDFELLGRDYCSRLQDCGVDNERVVNTLPFNYLYCGLIRQALPRAKIIHMVRDPRDVCTAIYKTLFKEGYLFSYEVSELAQYYQGYQRLMDHWRAVMPGEILDVSYEALVTDPAATLRGIFEWLSLDPENAGTELSREATCASAAPGRQPWHTRPVGLWRNYENQLAPLFEQLTAD